MKRLLAGRSARFAVTRSKPVVVVPVLVVAGAPPATDGGSAWRDAWRSVARSRGLVPLRLADASEAGFIGADGAAGADRARFADLAQRNDADAVLLTVATVSTGADGTSRVLKVASIRFATSGPGQPLPDKTFPLGAPENDAAVFNDAAVAVAQDVETVWRRGNAVSTKAVSTTTVRVPTLTLEDWVAMRRRLIELPQVERVQVVAVDREYADRSDFLSRRCRRSGGGAFPPGPGDAQRQRPVAGFRCGDPATARRAAPSRPAVFPRCWIRGGAGVAA